MPGKREGGFGVAQFQNTKTNQYLRITNDGNSVDVGGRTTGDSLTEFKIHPAHDQYGNSFALESVRFPNRYVSIQSDGSVCTIGMLSHLAQMQM